jgi:hypothetical protein
MAKSPGYWALKSITIFAQKEQGRNDKAGSLLRGSGLLWLEENSRAS